MVHNNAGLVIKYFNQKEGVDYKETFALVAGLEGIKILLTYTCFKNFKLF